MLKTILTYGAAAGLIAGGACFATAVLLPGHIPTAWGMALGYTTMLIALSAIVLAVKRYRDDTLGGVIGFWPAFGMGLAITMVASFLYALGWELALLVNGGSDAFIDGYIAQRRAEGGEPVKLAAELRQMADMRARYADPLFRIPVTITEIAPVGILVSLVTAALLRNPRAFPAR